MPENLEGNNPKQKAENSILKAPEYLEKEQNLYDQEPFVSLVESVSQSSGTPQDIIRTSISNAARVHRKKITTDPRFPTINLQYEPDPPSLRGKVPPEVKSEIFETLQNHFGWSEYLVTVGQYRYSYIGSQIPHAQPKNSQTPTYAKWLAQKKESWLVGIRDIFPQDVNHPVTSQPNTTGIRKENRR